MTELKKEVGLEELDDFADEIIEKFGKNRIFSFYGSMGSGKTTLISKLVKKLNGQESSSPTFSLVNVYEGDITIHHFDCYRLKGEKDIESIGFEEYFYSGNYCFIEWPEIIETLIPENSIKIYISVLSDRNKRLFRVC